MFYPKKKTQELCQSVAAERTN